MSDDLERVERALARSVTSGPSTEGLILRRDGVVSAVNSDGTVDVTIGGVTIPGVKRKAWYAPVVGDKVFVEVVDTDLVVDGRLGRIPAARASLSGDDTVASGGDGEPVQWQVEDFDTDTMIDIAGNPTRVTFRTLGAYLVVVYLLSNTGSADLADCLVRLNGVTTIQRLVNTEGPDDFFNASIIRSFNVNDYIEVRYGHNAGSDRQLQAGSYVSAVRLPV